jgi:peroxin-14
MIEKNKDSQTQSLTELQQELKSLKALLLSRGPGLSSTPSSPLPVFTGRPAIPAWQLAGANQTNGEPSLGPTYGISPSTAGNGKGKEVETVEAGSGTSS